jgi:hypothetical protein
MQNEGKGQRKKIFYEFEQRYNTPCELQHDIECYDKIMESHPNYPAIIYTYIIKFRQMLKILASKVKIIKKYRYRMVIIIL